MGGKREGGRGMQKGKRGNGNGLGRKGKGRGVFGEIFKAHVRAVPGNVHVKSEVRSFNRLELLAFN